MFVDRTGFEPVTSSMPWKRATSYANGPTTYFDWQNLLCLSDYMVLTNQCQDKLEKRPGVWALEGVTLEGVTYELGENLCT